MINESIQPSGSGIPVSSYELALAEAKRRVDAAEPSFDRDDLAQGILTRGRDRRKRRWLLTAAGGVALLAAMSKPALLSPPTPAQVVDSFPAALFGIAVALVRVEHLVAQLSVRVVLMLAVILGLFQFLQPCTLTSSLLTQSLAAASLLALGATGLESRLSPEGFRPDARRPWFLTAMVLGLCDTVLLLAVSVTAPIGRESLDLWAIVRPTLAAGLMLGGVHALYRMRTWGLAAILLANLVIAPLALSGWLFTIPPLAVFLGLTAALQLAVYLGILVTTRLFGVEPGDDEDGKLMRWSRWLLRAGLIALTLAPGVRGLAAANGKVPWCDEFGQTASVEPAGPSTPASAAKP